MNAIYLAASGAASVLCALDTSANNLANANTPGFRRFLPVMQSVAGGQSPYDYAAVGATARIDMAQGPLQATNNPLDLAITGPAFLAVQGPGGLAYTRNGELQVSADGTLLAAGYPVMSTGGAPISIPPGAVMIGGDGSLSVNGQPVAQLMLADPSGIAMIPAGGSLYRAQADATLPPAAPASSQLHQGYLEQATGSETGTMIGMMDAMRGYESAMKAVAAIDSNQNQAIQAFTLNA